MTISERELSATGLAKPEILLAGPWKGREQGKVLKAWGCQLDDKDLDGIAHDRQGGYWMHTLPGLAETLAYAVKASKHAEATIYLNLLCKAALASQFTMTECAVLFRECMRLDPVRDLSPRDWANNWVLTLMTFVNCWESRTSNLMTPSGAVGDPEFLERFIKDMQFQLGVAQVEQAEIDLSAKKAQFLGKDLVTV